MFCTNCGSELDEKWNACPKCGADVVRRHDEEINYDDFPEKVCRKCGVSIDDTWQACPYCGEELNYDGTQNMNEKEQYDKEIENETRITQKLGRVLKILILIVIVCFFCPMYMVSCGNQEVATLSGVDLTFGFTVAAEEVQGNLIFSLLVLLPILAFVTLLKNNSLDRKTEEGRKEIKQRFYICGAAMMSVVLFELYFFSTIQSNLEENMILYEATGTCYIMRIVALISVGFSTYQAHLFEPCEKEGKLLSKNQKILQSIKNVVIIALVLSIVIIAIYSKIMASFEL